MSAIVLFIAILVLPAVSYAQELKPIKLLPPKMEDETSLMQALKDRQTSREYSSEKLPLQVMSDLLWAAWGLNRTESGKRTAPSALNWQEIDVYVSTADGLFLYDAQKHTLMPILAKDIRALTGKQDFVKNAPVNLVYVADFSKMGDGSDENKQITASADTGFIGQNVYLYCASAGLATVVRGLIAKPVLEKAMELRPDQKVILAQTVGYPK